MLNKVAQYAKNVGKSVIYSAADVAGEMFTNPKSFVEENKESLKGAYNSVRDYRTTFKRVKDRIQKSDVYVAASVGVNSLIEDIKTGDWYAKDRETRLTEKFGGLGIGDDWDMDGAEFDWDKEGMDVSDGDKIIATAIKKNTKLNTMMTTDAIVTVGKAQIDASRENTTLLFMQNEKLMGSVNNGFERITRLLSDSANTNIKNQQKTWEKTAKFYEKIEKNTNTIVAQLDELLKMQRNLYEDQRQSQKKGNKTTATSVVNANGMLNLRDYKNAIRKNISDTITEATGLSMDSFKLGDGNTLALMFANPMRDLTQGFLKKNINKTFKASANNLNEVLGGLAYTLFGQLNNMKLNGTGMNKLMGSIFGMKMDREGNFDTSKYTKGPVPFDGITKKAITEVMPHHLAKIASALTGEDEEIFDYNSGRWTTKRAKYNEILKNEKNKAMSAMGDFFSYLKQGVGGDFNKIMRNKQDADKFIKGLTAFANAFYENPDFNMLRNPRDYGIDEDVAKFIQKSFQETKYNYRYTKKRDWRYGNGTALKDRDQQRIAGLDWSKGNPILTGRDDVTVVLANTIKSVFESRKRNADKRKDIGNNPLSLELLFASEGIDINKNSGEWLERFKNKHGDYDQKSIMNSPTAKAIAMTADQYGYTIFDYLKNIKLDLAGIRSNGLFSIALGGGDLNDANTSNSSEMSFEVKEKYDWKRLQHENDKRKRHDEEAFERRYQEEQAKWEQNERYRQSGDKRYNKRLRRPNRVDLSSDDVRSQFGSVLNDITEEFKRDEVERQKQEKANQKDMFDVLEEWGLITSDEKKNAQAVKYDKEKDLKEQMKAAQGGKAKLLLARAYMKSIADKPWQYATDAMVSTEALIHDIFFKHAFKMKNSDGETVEEKGLFGMLQESFKGGFDSLTNMIGTKLENFFTKEDGWWQKNVVKKLFAPDSFFGQLKEAIIGKPDGEGFRTGGITGSLFDALKRNAHDVSEIIKRDARSLTGKKDEEESSDTSSSSSESNSNNPADWQGVRTFLISAFSYNMSLDMKYNYADEYITWAQKKRYNPTAAKNPTNVIRYFTKIRKPAFDQTMFNTNNNSLFNAARLGEERRVADILSNRAEFNQSHGKSRADKKNYKFYTECENAISGLGHPEMKDEFIKFLKQNNITRESIAKEIGAVDFKNTTQITEYAKLFVAKLTETHKAKYAMEQKRLYRLNNVISGDRKNTSELKAEYTSNQIKANEEAAKAAKREAAENRVHETIEKVIGPSLQKIVEPIKKIAESLTRPIGTNTPDENSLNPIRLNSRGRYNAGYNERFESGLPGSAYGGVAKSDMTSILSPGEIVMGRGGSGVVPKMGVYGLSKGDVVINPASPAKASKQYAAERKYRNKLMANATVSEGTATDEKTIRQSILDFFNNGEKVDVATDYLAKAGIGGLAGALLGMPLLGAGLGIATGLSKRSNGFANAIFGDLGENGERADNGLISTELQKAFPSMRKGALLGGALSLVTPLGPLAGILLGGAAGIAEHEGMFDGLIFGEDSLLGDKEKFKQKLPKIGLGALAGAVFSPIGLLPGALLGSAAGMVASTDKFKEFIFGKEVDGKKQGGVVGTIKKAINPLKNFGQDLIESTMSAVFGEKVQDENGKEKREGGLMGEVKDWVIKPFKEGAESIAQSFKNVAQDIKDTFAEKIGQHFENVFGENLAARITDFLRNPLKKMIGGAVKVGGTIALSPFMAGAHMVKSVGNRLERGRIRRGTAYNRSAEERLQYRDQHKFGFGFDAVMRGRGFKNAESLEFDTNIADVARDRTSTQIGDIEAQLAALTTGDPYRDRYNQAKNDFSNSLLEYMNTADAGRVTKMLRYPAPDFKAAQKFIKSKAKGKDGRTLLDRADQEIILKALDQFKKDTQRIMQQQQVFKNTSKEQMLENLKKAGISEKFLKNKKGLEKLKKNFHTEYKSKYHQEAEDGIATPQGKIENNVAVISDQIADLPEKIGKAIWDAYYQYKNTDEQFNAEKSKRDDSFRKAKADYVKARGYANESMLTDYEIETIKSQIGYTDDEALLSRIRHDRSKVTSGLASASGLRGDVSERLATIREQNPGMSNDEIRLQALESLERDHDLRNASAGGNADARNFGGFKRQNNFLVRKGIGAAKFGARAVGAVGAVGSHVPLVGGLFNKVGSKANEFAGWLGENQMYSATQKDKQGSIIKRGSILTVTDDAYITKRRRTLGKIVSAMYEKFKNSYKPRHKGVKYKGTVYPFTIDGFKEYVKAAFPEFENEGSFSKELSLMQKKRKKDYADLIDRILNLKINQKLLDEAEKYFDSNKPVEGDGEIHTNAFLSDGFHPIRAVKNFFSGNKNSEKGSKDAQDNEKNSVFAKMLTELKGIKDNTKESLKDKIGNIKEKGGSLIQKIIKGAVKVAIFAPLFTGIYKQFVKPWVKEHLMPFFKDKLGPLFLGKKNTYQDEDGNAVEKWEGGMFSGLANMISPALAKAKNFFKGVKDWIFNKGEYSAPDRGSSGFLHSLVDLWKIGADAIMTKLPVILNSFGSNLSNLIGKGVETVAENAIPLIWTIGKGAIKGGINFLKGDTETKPGAYADDTRSIMNMATEYNSNNTNLDNQSKAILANAKSVHSVTNPFTGQKSLFAISQQGEINSLNTVSISPIGSDLAKMTSSYSSSQDSIIPKAKTNVKEKELTGTKTTDLSGVEVLHNEGNTKAYSKDDYGNIYDRKDIVEFAHNNLKDNASWQSAHEEGNMIDAVAADQTGAQRQSRGSRFLSSFVKDSLIQNASYRGLHGSTARLTGGLLQKTGKFTQKTLGKIPGLTGKLSKLTGKTVEVEGKAVSKATNKAGEIGSKMSWKNKLINRLADKLEDKGLDKILNTNVKDLFKKNAKEAAEEGIEHGAKGAITKMEKEVAEKAAKEVAGEAVEKVAKEGGEKALKEMAEEAAEKGAKKAVTEGAEKAAKSGMLSKLTGFIKNAFKKLFGEGSVMKEFIEGIASKFGKKITSKGVEEGIEEGAEKAAKEVVEQCAKKSVTIAGKIIGAIIEVAVMLIDYSKGKTQAADILQVTPDELDSVDRQLAGLAKVLSGLVIVLTPTQCVQAVIHLFESIAKCGLEDEYIRRQEEAQEFLKAYNEEHGTDMSLEEYNYSREKNKMDRVFWHYADKAGNGLMNGITGIPGRIKTQFKNLKEGGIKKVFAQSLDWTRKDTKAIGNWFKGAAKDVWETDTFKGVREGAKAAGDWIVDKGSDVVSGAKKYAKKGWNAVTSLFNARADQNMYPIPSALLNGLGIDPSGVTATIQGSIKNGLSSAFGKVSDIGKTFKSLISKNSSVDKKINDGTLTPLDSKFWEVRGDSKGGIADSMFSLKELMERVVKAPFAIVSNTMKNVTGAMSSDKGDIKTTKVSTSTDSKSDTSFTSKLTSSIKTGISKIKSIFGMGSDDSYGNGTYDPDHIYQRNYSGSYSTKGDSTRQTLADSGCGPAAAATVARKFGIRDANITEAGKYAMANNYKEVNGGTYPAFFTDYLAKKGIPANVTSSNKSVLKSLLNGNPVVLMGNDYSNSGNTPYGSQAHYVVATGIDKNGKVIVEDSESRTSGDRYDLASTLANSSVKITTGMGKETLLSKFISNTANAILVPYGKILKNVLNTSSTKKGSTSGSVGGNPGDASKMKGKTLTLSDDAGNTHTISITDDEVELYAMLTGECGLSPAAACGAIGNWEQECGINSIKSVATRGVIYYGGGIMQWTPGSKHENWARDNGFAGDVWSWEANLAHAKHEIMNGGNWANPANASPSFASQGLTPVGSFEEFKKLSDPESAAANFERVFEVSGDWNGRNSEGVHYSENMIYDRLRRLNAKILYELIVNGKSDTDSTGKGKSKADRILSRFGKGTDGYDYMAYYDDAKATYDKHMKEMNDLKNHRGTFKNLSGPGYDAAWKRVNDDLQKAKIQFDMAETFRNLKKVGKTDAEAFETVYKSRTNMGNRFPDKYGTVVQDSRSYKEISENAKADEAAKSGATTSSTTTASSGKQSLFSIISNDIIAASKKLFGPLYDALFGDTAEEEGATSSSGVPGDVNTNFNGQIVAPFRGKFKCSCRFGWYNDGVHPNGHNGTDLLSCGSSDEDWTVYSLCDGVVTHVTSGYAPNTGCLGSSDGGGAGNYVEITGTDGYIYQFMHLNAIHQDIKENAQVYIGSPIGIGGHTGSSTGRHLHFGIKKSDGTFVNPEVYIMGFPNDDIVEYQEYESHLFTGQGKKAPKISMSEFKFGTARSPRTVSQSRQAELAMRMKSANKKIYNTLGAENQSYRRKLLKTRAEDNRNPQLIQTGIYADAVHNTARRSVIPQTNIKINGSDAVAIPANSGMGMGRGSESTINLELTSVVEILKTIADNSARNEQIVQLLAAIVANTAAKNGDTTTADLLKLITTAGGSPSTSAPITALNSILNNSTSKDISSAVYQIAKN